MATGTYRVFFGPANAGGTPTFSLYVRTDTYAALPYPAFTERGGGFYEFQQNWAGLPAGVTILFACSLNGVDQGDEIERPAEEESTGGAGVVASVTTAIQSYDLFFGTENAGGVPTWVQFANAANNAALTPPAFVDLGFGRYGFSVDWSNVGVSAIRYIASLNGVELADTINSGTTTGQGTAVVTPASWSLVGFSTAGGIISRAALQLNLSSSLIADPYASTDPAIVQLCDLLTTVGTDLLREHDWRHLMREASIATIADQATYAMPADYRDMVRDSGWNTGSGLRMVGPLSPQRWQAVKATLAGVVVDVGFRLRGQIIEVGPTVPAAGTVCRFEYASRYWVQSALAVNGPDLASPTLSTDTVLYDPELVLAALKRAWLEDRGLDTQMAEVRYRQRLEGAIGRDMEGATLSLAGPRARGWGPSVPEGSWSV